MARSPSAFRRRRSGRIQRACKLASEVLPFDKRSQEGYSALQAWLRANRYLHHNPDSYAVDLPRKRWSKYRDNRHFASSKTVAIFAGRVWAAVLIHPRLHKEWDGIANHSMCLGSCFLNENIAKIFETIFIEIVYLSFIYPNFYTFILYNP